MRYRWTLEGDLPKEGRADQLRKQLQLVLDTFSNGNIQVVGCYEIDDEEFVPHSSSETVWPHQEEDTAGYGRRLHLVSEKTPPKAVREDSASV